jgi:hypothetical protein
MAVSQAVGVVNELNRDLVWTPDPVGEQLLALVGEPAWKILEPIEE